MEKTTKSKQDVRQEPGLQKGLVIHRVFDLPVNRVWRALTEAEEFKKWWGPEGYSCPYSNVEARVGGKYLNCMRGPDGKDNWSTGTVKELVPEKKLVVTDSFSDEKGNIINASGIGMPGKWPDELLITFELEETDGATKLRLQHEGIPPEMHDDCMKGWNECLDKLEKNCR
ncbi:MAG: SRPBCC domain-containing protein [Chitinophagaceae bacterium]